MLSENIDHIRLIHIYKHYQYKMIFYCVRRTIAPEEAQSIVQEAFEKVLKCEKLFKSYDHQRDYLFKVVKNIAFDYLKEKRKWQTMTSDIPTEVAIANESENEWELIRVTKLIWDVIEILPDQRKKVMIEIFRHDKKDQEIASCLNMKAGTVRSTKRSALKEIRQKLLEKGFQLPEQYLFNLQRKITQ